MQPRVIALVGGSGFPLSALPTWLWLRLPSKKRGPWRDPPFSAL